MAKKESKLTLVTPEVREGRKSLYRCECGNEKMLIRNNVNTGNTKSCGCFRSANSRQMRESDRKTHGHTIGGKPSKTYNSWRSMVRRCTDLSNNKWKYYGGRGITVCERWFQFENFLSDMGDRPKDCTLDRINVDGNYEPNNCRWASTRQQRANRTDKKESIIQSEVRDYLRERGWLVYVTTCGAYMKGLPDLICHHPVHGTRLVDVKRPKSGKLTKAQCQTWTDFERFGLGVWIMTECDDSVLHNPPNFRSFWLDSYDKYLVRSGADILEEFLDSDE